MHDLCIDPPLVHLALLQPSDTNPRKRINASALAELAETIAQHGVMHPILARPRPEAPAGEVPLEIVAGERRWRACTLLHEGGRNPHGDSIPCIVRELSDTQVLAMQLVENLQRNDLHPLEEAEHYHRMRTHPVAPASVEDIARTAHVSPQRVYARLSLLGLEPAAREAFLQEHLSLTLALQVARLPAVVQAEATQHLVDWGGEPMGPRAAARFLRDRYMLRLAVAPFDPADETLVPAAGACGACPKRTGANPELFGDIAEADLCTDPQCHAGKATAHRDRQVDDLRREGHAVAQGDQARSMCTPDGRHFMPGWHDLADPVPHALGDPALQVADVLTRARLAPSQVFVVDHPAAPEIRLAVGSDDLAAALRSIKAHRQQLDRVAEKARKTAAPPPTSGAAAAHSGAAGGTAPADSADADDTRDSFLQELLAFKPPPTVGGRYAGVAPQQYQQQQERRAFGILAAAEVGARMLRDGSEGLPPFKLAQMLCVLLWWGEAYLTLHEAARLADVQLPQRAAPRFSGAHAVDEPQALWDLPDAEAERLAMVLLAAQEGADDSPLRHFAETVLIGMDIPPAPLLSTAIASVREHLQLGALATGTPVADKKPPVKYRCPQTGSTWSGRGLQPKWLKTALAAGAKLADFAVEQGAQA